MNIMIATYRTKELRHKCGVLLSILAFCDFSCLMFEIVSGARMVLGIAAMKKTKCFWLQTGNIIIENAEVYMIFAVSLDRQLAIQEPIRYRTWKTKKYVILMTIPAIIYGLFYYIWSYVTLVQEDVEVCNLPSAMPTKVSEYWNYTSTLACFITVFCYVLTFVMLYKITPKNLRSEKSQIEQQRRIVKTLSINVFGFFISSVLSSGIIMYFRNIGVSEDVVGEAETYAVIPGLLSYSLNYYVYFWRSSEYRKAFAKQIGINEEYFNRGQETMFGQQSTQVLPFRRSTITNSLKRPSVATVG
ncbi:unnamed protein product [Bursaphelenchus okinawaensis]|uniref:G-protein coupled receptors family 1 profile domain-containing protein n=1 Tax=Bursaphelenchus okinawaensis TaxID=465554 RepID=A0A811LSZ3_9BILA|nr:unnamed protein product [Bursaphelenchus okinawaensis]CAG9127988.1 unnamed protein product [Bursaphelenchus okinawaensis]